MWVYVLALLAALLVGGASVLQQRAASQAPPEHNLSIKLLAWLARRPLWLAGVGSSVLGNLVFALAVGVGSVALAEALLVVRLLFALPLAAAWGRHTVPARDWGGAVAITLGLAAFILATQPREGPPRAGTNADWAIACGTIAALVLATTLVARKRGPTRKAFLLGGGAGCLFGLQAPLTSSAIDLITHAGVVGLLTTWNGYAVVAAAITGMLLVQSGYELAPLPASYPAVVTMELLAGIAVGVTVLNGEMRLVPVSVAIGAGGLLAMVAGIAVLTTSPLVTGELDRLERRHEEGLARRTEAQLDRDLRRADADLDRLEAHRGRPRTRRHLKREIRRVHAALARLGTLQHDIQHHRDAESSRAEHLPAHERTAAAEMDRDMAAWERDIDDRAVLLREHARTLQGRADAISSDPSPRRRRR